VGAIPNIEIRRLSGALGAEVECVDLGQIDDATFAAIYEAFLVHQVLVFAGQKLDADAYTALASRFGAPAIYPFTEGLESHPEITPLIKEAHQTSNFGGMWYAGTTYQAAPPKATMLMARETPEAGGDTLFACQYKA